MDNFTELNKRTELESLFRGYLTVLPSPTFDERGIYQYAIIFKDVPTETVTEAMDRLAKKISYYPSVAEILDEIAILTDGECDAYEAWENALEVASNWRQNWGMENSQLKKFKNDDVKKAAKRFGIYILQNITSDNALEAREQFVELYNSMIRRKRAGE